MSSKDSFRLPCSMVKHFQISETVRHDKSPLPFERVLAVCNIHSCRAVWFAAQLLLDVNTS